MIKNHKPGDVFYHEPTKQWVRVTDSRTGCAACALDIPNVLHCHGLGEHNVKCQKWSYLWSERPKNTIHASELISGYKNQDKAQKNSSQKETISTQAWRYGKSWRTLENLLVKQPPKEHMNKQLAKIKSAELEIQERGILNFWIFVDYEGGGSQGIGGIALDCYDKEEKRRVGTAYGCEMIRRLLLALGVNDFSEMSGKIIWVLGEGEGLSFKPKGIKQLDINGGGDAVVFAEIAAEFEL